MADSSLPDESRFLSKKRNRKLSWVGVDENTPFSYLRETMVADLMQGICDPESMSGGLNPRHFQVEDSRKRAVEKAVGEWSFSAHDFTDDELLWANLTILRHALQMPELEKWRISDDELTVFLLASRAAYNDFVLYHNFRHISDVLQAVFFFLVSLGTLPPYPAESASNSRDVSPIAKLLKPTDALTLLISAIGHDVGHPGVNNAFLVALNAPLAQLYNDRSVLESFHCAAYSQILRRHWPQAFNDTTMRKLMIETILATDMGVHFKYMSDLGNLQSKLAHNDRTTDGWSLKVLEEYRDLTCGLLIKCADISNVARDFEVAAKWANILTDEFSNQGQMETRLNMPTCLFGGPPALNDPIKLGQSQLGFMNVFARPLFESVTDVLPAMQFSVDALSRNKERWDKEITKVKEAKLEQQMKKAGGLGKGHGHLHLRGLIQSSNFDGGLSTPSPKSNSMEFLVDAPTSGAMDIQSPVSPKQVDRSSPSQEELSPKTKGTEASNNPPTQAVEDQSANGTDTQRKLTKKKRDSVSKKPKSRSRSRDQTKSMTYMEAQNLQTGSGAQAPDEGPGSVVDFNGAALRSDNGNGSPTLNGSLSNARSKSKSVGDILKPSTPNSLSATGDAATHGLELEHSISAPGPGDTASGESKSTGKKFGLGKFWKKRWRAVSGTRSGNGAEQPGPS